MWQALGQVAGAGTNWLAGDMEQRRLQALENGREAGRYWDEAQQRQEEERQRRVIEEARVRRLGSTRQLATSLGSPNRLAAGESARARLGGQIAESATAVAPMPERTLVDPRGGGNRWAARAATPMRQVYDARTRLLTQDAATRGMGEYDQSALAQHTETGMDIDRQLLEEKRDLDKLKLARAKLMAQNEIAYKDTGPSRTSQNLQLIGGVLGAAGGVADDYSAERAASERAAARKAQEDADREEWRRALGLGRPSVTVSAAR
jgi:hypothetical protein